MATLNEQVKGWQDEATGDHLKGVFEVRWTSVCVCVCVCACMRARQEHITSDW